MKKKAGIAVDNYKVTFFKKRLLEAGFHDFKVKSGVAKDTKLIVVKYTIPEFEKLHKVIEIINFKYANRN